MTFSRVKPAGWLQDELLTPAQINGLDINQSNAIDGAAGGIYSPGADIQLPGANGIQWGDGRYPKLTPRYERRVLNLCKLSDHPIDSWNFTLSWSQGSVNAEALSQENDDPLLYLPVDNLIDGASLCAIRLWLCGAVNHVGLPTRMPWFKLIRVPEDGVHSFLGTATDASATVSAYQAAHSVTLSFATPIAITESDESRFVLQIKGEGGVNALASLQVKAASALYLADSLRPGG